MTKSAEPASGTVFSGGKQPTDCCVAVMKCLPEGDIGLCVVDSEAVPPCSASTIVISSNGTLVEKIVEFF